MQLISKNKILCQKLKHQQTVIINLFLDQRATQSRNQKAVRYPIPVRHLSANVRNENLQTKRKEEITQRTSGEFKTRIRRNLREISKHLQSRYQL